MRGDDLVHPLFVTQTTCFGMPDVCSVKGEWVEYGIADHEVMVIKYTIALNWGRHPCGILSYLYQKVGPC